MLLVQKNDSYYLNPTEAEFQILSNKQKKRDGNCWSVTDRGPVVTESVIEKMTFDHDHEEKIRSTL